MSPNPPTFRIHRVSNHGELCRFADALHAAALREPAAVPPNRLLLRARLAGAFRSGLTLFYAEAGGTVRGTLGVRIDARHDAVQGERVAFFGFYEIAPGPGASATSRALLHEARRVARAAGADVLRGPRNFSRIEEIGVTVEGHHRTPPFLAGHHPERYAELLLESGLRPHYDVLAYETPLVDEEGEPRELPRRLRVASERAKRRIEGLVVRDASRLHLVRDLRLAHRVFVEGFRDVPENTPMPLAQWLAVGLPMLAVTDPRMLQIATVHGEPVGFALCFAELNEALAGMAGSSSPMAWLRFAAGLRRKQTASFKLLGVLPRYRGTGLHARLIAGAIDGCQRAGYQRLEASLVDARNTASRKVVEGAGMRSYRRYRVFEGGV